MKTGNKGEWSELYVFFKVLADQKLLPGDAFLNTTASHFYPVVEIIRNEKGKVSTFTLSAPNVIVNKNSASPLQVPISSFDAQAKALFKIIKTGKSTFTAPMAEDFLNALGATQIKADSATKADIVIQIHDARTNLQPILGFSIKSKLGSASTLLNATHPTNFIYKITGYKFTLSDITAINAVATKSKVRDRVKSILSKGAQLSLNGFENNTFKNNLILIDSCMPEILAHALLIFNEKGISSMALICAELVRLNPLGFDQSLSHKFYEVKLKRFLSEIALGMMPAKVWTGKYNGTEGYIIVKADGELACYHIIEKNLFEDYLLANTKLETASTDRHGFGSIYEDGSEQFIKFNLQIRFL
ncbi:HpaII family restriction endonuclease [Pedobacter frigiditerrae]|uniref:HpaII family restriction endonuclease n=1 Tax=Pedobacter frigiditerrae TaxID=2530452 RepID=A0A4R0MTF2_9SPHI|nr:HpaII family restriction endonuclease [Pedobacter frigiditerrae]TCC90349.1 HpaII family restriction endonuclease [Pedobacter frigiditerrae]